MAAFDDQSGITPEAIPDIAALFRSKPVLFGFVREGEAAGSSASSASAEEYGRGLGMSFQALGTYAPQAPAPVRDWCPTQDEVDRSLESTKSALNRQLGNKAKQPLYCVDWKAGKQALVYNYVCPEQKPAGLAGDAIFEWIESSSTEWRDASHGTAAVFPLESSEPGCYQDGSAAEDSEIVLYHSSRPALLNKILEEGLAPSIYSHGICGAWTFALAPWAAYRWGSCILEPVEGMVFTVKLPRRMLTEKSPRTPAADTVNTGLVSNQRIRGDGSGGYLRFVVPGQYMNSALPIRMTSVSFLLRDPNAMTFSEGLSYGVRLSALWVLGHSVCDEGDLALEPGLQPQRKPLLQGFDALIKQKEDKELADLLEHLGTI
ncbi:unnamed protein product [Effrenium voratum]|uniref:Uncharacterized protein n=1 Tax=Effrenium voratum TaxID=2562239 RepID=A0AA36IJV7_9DINO|nr:unnamed protein product [Effrenium voratum]